MCKSLNFLTEILTEEEFNEIQTIGGIEESLKLYNDEFIDSVEIIKIKDKRFLVNKNKISKMHNGWQKTLELLVDHEELINPVYVSVEDDGTLLVD